MEDPYVYLQNLVKEGPQVPYMIHLFFRRKPVIRPRKLLAALRSHCGNVEESTPDGASRTFVMLDHVSRYQDAFFPALAVISEIKEKINPADTVVPALLQTRDWPEASSRVNDSRYIISVTMGMTDGLHRTHRLRLVDGIVQAVLSVLDVSAIHWIPSQRLVDPAGYASHAKRDGVLMASALNIRMFLVEGTEDEKIMDTIGLSAFGVSDVQCHFRMIDPVRMASILFGYAEYLFEKGEVFRDGTQLPGLSPEEKWSCRHENSAAPPERMTLSIYPGQYSPVLES